MSRDDMLVLEEGTVFENKLTGALIILSDEEQSVGVDQSLESTQVRVPTSYLKLPNSVIFTPLRWSVLMSEIGARRGESNE